MLRRPPGAAHHHPRRPVRSCPFKGRQGAGVRAAAPSPSAQEGFFPHPHLFVLFQQLLQLLLLLLLPLAVILGRSQLGARRVSAEPTLPPSVSVG